MAPTPYPDVNALLDDLLTGVREILRDRLVGVYLDGSLALSSFEPDRSDVDLVVVTTGDLDLDTVRALAALHARLAARHPRWGRELECSYIARDALRHARRPGPHPHIERGDGGLELIHPEAGYWVLHRWVLREHGLALAGPAPAMLVDPVTSSALREAVANVLREWWAPMLADPTRLRSWGYRAYAVLTMCRMLYTLEHGRIVSKAVAAGWAKSNLPRRWTPVIDQARAWSVETPADFDETLALVRHTLERSRG
jgi:hypothetical protein